MQIAAFDVVPTDDMFIDFFGLEPPDPVNENFEIVGFETTLFIFNLGSLTFAILSFPVLALTAVFLRVFRNNYQV